MRQLLLKVSWNGPILAGINYFRHIANSGPYEGIKVLVLIVHVKYLLMEAELDFHNLSMICFYEFFVTTINSHIYYKFYRQSRCESGMVKVSRVTDD